MQRFLSHSCWQKIMSLCFFVHLSGIIWKQYYILISKDCQGSHFCHKINIYILFQPLPMAETLWNLTTTVQALCKQPPSSLAEIPRNKLRLKESFGRGCLGEVRKIESKQSYYTTTLHNSIISNEKIGSRIIYVHIVSDE